MKILLTQLLTFCLLFTFLNAAPTEKREWSTSSGHKTEAVALKFENGLVHLKKSNGSVVKLKISLLSEADQTFLKDHFKIDEESAKALPEGSGAASAEGLPYPVGKISGPIEFRGSNYYLYLPKTLKKGRKASLLFYTHSTGGGKGELIKVLTDAAETLGWVMAISVESSNAGAKNNQKHVSNCLDHILKTLPVDEERIHYTGNSGGASRAFYNTGIKKAFGVMPNVGYIPYDFEPKTKVVYALGGGNDYNRYLTAIAAHEYGDHGFHRMSSGGHGPSPADFYIDGMIWMHCKYLKMKNPRRDEKEDFEFSIIKWMNKLKATDPKRAYSTACIVRDIYKISGSNAALNNDLIIELSKDETNVLYHEGLSDIDELSEKTLRISGGTRRKHFSKDAAKLAEKLKLKYKSVKEIMVILNAIIKKTV